MYNQKQECHENWQITEDMKATLPVKTLDTSSHAFFLSALQMDAEDIKYVNKMKLCSKEKHVQQL